MASKGGRRPGAGRPKGAVTKAGADVRELARVYVADAVHGLAQIAKDAGAPPAARVAAWNAILDRAVGKPAQAVTGDGGEGPVQIVVSTGIVRADP